MTRDKDDKRGNKDLDNDFDRKVEARYTKEAKATQTRGGKLDGHPPKLGDSHRTDRRDRG